MKSRTNDNFNNIKEGPNDNKVISNNINNAPNQDSINKNIIKFSFNNEIHEIINKNNGKDLINSTEEIISSILLIINLEKTFRNLAS